MDGKVVEHCMNVGVHYEYSHQFDQDEQVYRNTRNMIALSKSFKKKGNTNGGKDNDNTIEKQSQK